MNEQEIKQKALDVYPEDFAWCKCDEEDEKKIMWIVRLISTAGFRELDNDKMPCSRSELLEWLKSLKSHWKPSEKQLEELEFVTRGNSYPHLTSLYQDLKNFES